MLPLDFAARPGAMDVRRRLLSLGAKRTAERMYA
jgi:hypothetical protein